MKKRRRTRRSYSRRRKNTRRKPKRRVNKTKGRMRGGSGLREPAPTPAPTPAPAPAPAPAGDQYNQIAKLLNGILDTQRIINEMSNDAITQLRDADEEDDKRIAQLQNFIKMADSANVTRGKYNAFAAECDRIGEITGGQAPEYKEQFDTTRETWLKVWELETIAITEGMVLKLGPKIEELEYMSKWRDRIPDKWTQLGRRG